MRMLTKHIFLFVSVIILGTVSSTYIIEKLVGKYLRQSQFEWATILVDSLREAVFKDIIDGSETRVRDVLQKIADGDQAIEYIIVTDMDGILFTHTFKDKIPEHLLQEHFPQIKVSELPKREIVKYSTATGDIWKYTVPLVEGLGAHIDLAMNESKIALVLSKMRRNIILVMAIIGLFSTIMVFLLSRHFTRPFLEYMRKILSYSHGNEVDFAKVEGKSWEVDRLISGFNNVISARESAEKKLRNREENLSLTLDSIGDAVIVTDQKAQVSRMNPVATSLTGWTAELAAGRSINEIFHIIDATDGTPIENPVDKVLKTGEVVHLSNHTTLISRDGTEFQIADSAAPIRGQDGIVTGVILVFNDVTEQYKLREAAKTTIQQLSSLMSDMQTMVAVLKPDGTIRFINDTALRLALLQPEDVMGKALWDCSWFNHDPKVQSLIREDCIFGAKGIPTQRDVKIHTSRGLRWVDFRLHPVFNDQGMVTQIVPEWRDINEQYLTRQALVKSENEQKQILGTIAIAIVTVDENGKILSFNQFAQKIFGYSAEEAIGQNSRILIPEAYHSDFDRYFERLLKDGEVAVIGLNRAAKAITKSGNIFPIQISVANLPAAEDGVRRFIVSCIDRTEHIKQEEQIRRTQKMDALGKLTGGIAHDYNNMLGVIIGYSELMEISLNDNKKALGQIRKIRHAADRSAKLTQKLLSFSRGGSDHAKKVQINKVLNQVSDMIAKSLTARIDLELDLTEKSWPVWLDVDELEDLILNMSINAQHAMPEGGTLTFKTEAVTMGGSEARRFNIVKGDYMRLSIIDTGIGIDEAILPNIFDPFFTTKGEKGTGLGLSQVYNFVKNSGGNITVYSEKGQGSQFNILFPRYHIYDQENPQGDMEEPEAYNGSEKLLIVDDEEALRELAVNILEPYGYQIFQAEGGEAALNFLLENEIDLMISDVIMPKMGGFELAKEVMKLYPKIKIQMISGFADNRDNKTGNESLHKNILTKPYKTSDLLRNIRILLDG